jgi:hypothetical protein
VRKIHKSLVRRKHEIIRERHAARRSFPLLFLLRFSEYLEAGHLALSSIVVLKGQPAEALEIWRERDKVGTQKSAPLNRGKGWRARFTIITAQVSNVYGRAAFEKSQVSRQREVASTHATAQFVFLTNPSGN